jgi:prepilin signal peptidase PulO-like enzyme (type II secretory pathway)
MNSVVLLPAGRVKPASTALAVVAVIAVASVSFTELPVGSAASLTAWSIPVAAAAAVDFRTGRLPDAIVLPGLLAALLLALTAGGVGGALAGALLFCGPMLLVHLARPDGLGFGDVKFSALLGTGLGIVAVPLVVPAFLLAAIVHGVPCLVAGVRGRLVPFGPSLAAASIATVLVTAPGMV